MGREVALRPPATVVGFATQEGREHFQGVGAYLGFELVQVSARGHQTVLDRLSRIRSLVARSYFLASSSA